MKSPPDQSVEPKSFGEIIRQNPAALAYLAFISMRFLQDDLKTCAAAFPQVILDGLVEGVVESQFESGKPQILDGTKLAKTQLSVRQVCQDKLATLQSDYQEAYRIWAERFAKWNAKATTDVLAQRFVADGALSAHHIFAVKCLKKLYKLSDKEILQLQSPVLYAKASLSAALKFTHESAKQAVILSSIPKAFIGGAAAYLSTIQQKFFLSAEVAKIFQQQALSADGSFDLSQVSSLAKNLVYNLVALYKAATYLPDVAFTKIGIPVIKSFLEGAILDDAELTYAATKEKISIKTLRKLFEQIKIAYSEGHNSEVQFDYVVKQGRDASGVYMLNHNKVKSSQDVIVRQNILKRFGRVGALYLKGKDYTKAAIVGSTNLTVAGASSAAYVAGLAAKKLLKKPKLAPKEVLLQARQITQGVLLKGAADVDRVALTNFAEFDSFYTSQRKKVESFFEELSESRFFPKPASGRVVGSFKNERDGLVKAIITELINKDPQIKLEQISAVLIKNQQVIHDFLESPELKTTDRMFRGIQAQGAMMAYFNNRKLRDQITSTSTITKKTKKQRMK